MLKPQKNCNNRSFDAFGIETNMVDLNGNSEESGDYESEESGDMPHFDMLVGADPYQEGSGPLLGATVYRDYPEELVKEIEKEIKIEVKKEKTLIETLLSMWI